MHFAIRDKNTSNKHKRRKGGWKTGNRGLSSSRQNYDSRIPRSRKHTKKTGTGTLKNRKGEEMTKCKVRRTKS